MQRLLCFTFILMVFSVHSIEAQFIKAGVTNSTTFCNDFNPDSLVFAPFTSNNSFDSLIIDLNNDNVTDFKIYSEYLNGGNWYTHSNTTISPLNNNELAIEGIDSCLNNCPPLITISKFALIKALDSNETISSSLTFIDSTAYVIFSGWDANYPNGCGWSCSRSNFNTAFKYIGLRVNLNNDSIYGWIKIRERSSGGYIIDSYACEASGITSVYEERLSSFTVFPNPAQDFITIIKDSKNRNSESITLFDSFGQEVLSRVFEEEVTIDINHLPSGFYYIHSKTRTDSSVSKLVKY